jgi:hypothetical protein
MEVPAWLVSVMALVASFSLLLVRPMPFRIRISIIVPFLSFALLYFWVQAYPEVSISRINLVRINLLIVFGSIVWNSLAVVYAKYAGR